LDRINMMMRIGGKDDRMLMEEFVEGLVDGVFELVVLEEEAGGEVGLGVGGGAGDMKGDKAGAVLLLDEGSGDFLGDFGHGVAGEGEDEIGVEGAVEADGAVAGEVEDGRDKLEADEFGLAVLDEEMGLGTGDDEGGGEFVDAEDGTGVLENFHAFEFAVGELGIAFAVEVAGFRATPFALDVERAAEFGGGG